MVGGGWRLLEVVGGCWVGGCLLLFVFRGNWR